MNGEIGLADPFDPAPGFTGTFSDPAGGGLAGANWASTAQTGLGSAMQTGGSVYGAFTGAKVAKWNAKAMKQMAQGVVSLVPNVRSQAAMASQRIRERGQAVVGRERAAAGAMGVDVSTGSPVMVMLDTIRKSSEDAWLTRYKGDVAAWELSEKARQMKAQAGLMEWEGKQEEIGAYIQAGSSILGGLLGLAAGGMG